MAMIQPGAMLNHFRIEEQIGSGGMGAVYRGTDTTLQRQVAIKVLAARLSEVPENLERFQREARTIASLRHPNLMQIYYVGEDKGCPYFVMEYIRGRTLQALLQQQNGKLAPKEALRILIEIAAALSKVHASGIIHRDLKPANIMFDQDDDRAILVDFGLCKECAATSGLTEEGAILGTPDYMAPEQIEGGELGPHTDLYALGVILYQMLTGVSPFRRKTTIQTLRAHCESSPPLVTAHNPELSAPLAAILERLLCVDPQERYRSIEALAVDLNRVCRHPLLSRIIKPRETVEPNAATQISRTPIAGKGAPVEMRLPDADTPMQSAPGAVVALTPATGRSRRRRTRALLLFGVLTIAVMQVVLLAVWFFSPPRKRSRPSASTQQVTSAVESKIPAVSASTVHGKQEPGGSAVGAVAASTAPVLPVVGYKNLGAKAASPGLDNPGVTVLLQDGSRVRGRLSALDRKTATILLVPRGTREIAVAEIRGIISQESVKLAELLQQRAADRKISSPTEAPKSEAVTTVPLQPLQPKNESASHPEQRPRGHLPRHDAAGR